MKTKYILTIIGICFYTIAIAQDVTAYSSLEIGYPTNTTNDLPTNVVLGVNGQVYIGVGKYDSADADNYDPATGTTIRNIKTEYLDNFLLWVEKGVVAEDLAIGNRAIWLADYVFAEDYKLTSLEELKAYVKEHNHLPNVIGQKQLDDQGFYRINEMLIGQLQNLEELLLHTIEQEKKIKAQEEENKALEALVIELEKRLEALEQTPINETKKL